jgi:hypothetical protein
MLDVDAHRADLELRIAARFIRPLHADRLAILVGNSPYSGIFPRLSRATDTR